ncbi:TetR/AcrR family transcriptional regulator [Streptomyces sp. NBC_01217]|uniref:TetR/AcrR family transcriptional regulator n=1 Tax=Streptomyces sp. NBC_01217 TaxID=2903779 RepID=UPI002E1453D5|nr:TetR/AcrR family transcriptional regulator [Streptomyces sp. NBC_01217]
MGDERHRDGIEIVAAGQPPAERADAARNRQRILDAAEQLLSEHGPEAVTMNSVAQVAGIGVGTVYRRFGDLTQLLLALVDHRERQFQQTFLSGPAPLGPGAPPGDRLRAFFHALTDHVAEHQTVMLAAETVSPLARYTTGPYLAWHLHVSMLVRQIRPDADAAVLADLLLSLSSPSLIRHLTARRGTTPEQIKTSIDQLLKMPSR